MVIEQLISDDLVIEEKRDEWDKVEDKEDGYGQRYFNPVHNSYWNLLFVETDHHGNYKTVFIREPIPNQSELIDIALASNEMDDVVIASALLMYNERDSKMEFREELIDRLENHEFDNNVFEKDRLKNIVQESCLFDSCNLRPVVGKTAKEVEEDFQFYNSIAIRANRLLKEH